MRPVAALLLLAAARHPGAAATTLLVEVRDAQGAAVPEAVVYAVPRGKRPPPPSRRAVLDQKNRMFVPHILPIQTGTAVTFPNSDNVRHQVYSFSPAKRFQLLNQVIAAIGNLIGVRLVSGGSTMDDCCNITIDKFQSVVYVNGSWLTRKSKFI
jgi:plastocyanin